jgi:hypothetical protein
VQVGAVPADAMPKTLAELNADERSARAPRTHSVCGGLCGGLDGGLRCVPLARAAAVVDEDARRWQAQLLAKVLAGPCLCPRALHSLVI